MWCRGSVLHMIVKQVKILDQSLLLRGIFGWRWSDGVDLMRGGLDMVFVGEVWLMVDRLRATILVTTGRHVWFLLT